MSCKKIHTWEWLPYLLWGYFDMLSKRIFSLLGLMTLLPISACSNGPVPASEAIAIQQITQIVEENIRTAAKHGPAPRDVHFKAHGCVKAEFHVLQLPDAMQSGIFTKAARTYPAWIRYSNGSGKVQDDSVGDARGMAIKLMGIESSQSGTQDFVMINHPVFFVRNATDYLEFQKAVAQDALSKFFLPGLNPLNLRLHELAVAFAIRSRKVDNPLDIQYWSATPYRFGDTAMKFSVRPCGKPIYASAESGSPNFLRENMRKHLANGDACFDFMVQLRTHPMDMPIEDPTIEWSDKDSPFIPAAKITIPSQAFDTPEQLKFCEDLSFTPWHAVFDHQPLGGINRVRKAVYDTSSRIRHELNGIESREPIGF